MNLINFLYSLIAFAMLAFVFMLFGYLLYDAVYRGGNDQRIVVIFLAPSGALYSTIGLAYMFAPLMTLLLFSLRPLLLYQNDPHHQCNSG